MDNKTMTAEKSKNGGVSDEMKQKVLDSLSKISNNDEKLNYLVNRLVQHEIESSKAKTESQQLEAQTKRAQLVSSGTFLLDYANFKVLA